MTSKEKNVYHLIQDLIRASRALGRAHTLGQLDRASTGFLQEAEAREESARMALETYIHQKGWQETYPEAQEVLNLMNRKEVK